LGRKSVLKAIEGRSHLPRSQESGLGAGKRFDGTGRADTMLASETEWPAMIAGRMSFGKCRFKRVLPRNELKKMAAGVT
jgi:hypothetical protein